MRHDWSWQAIYITMFCWMLGVLLRGDSEGGDMLLIRSTWRECCILWLAKSSASPPSTSPTRFPSEPDLGAICLVIEPVSLPLVPSAWSGTEGPRIATPCGCTLFRLFNSSSAFRICANQCSQPVIHKVQGNIQKHQHKPSFTCFNTNTKLCFLAFKTCSFSSTSFFLFALSLSRPPLPVP